MSSRRQFLKTVALASAAAATPGASRTAAAAAARAARASTRPAAPAVAPRSAADRAEIEKQKKGTRDTLATIRKYELPPGSPLAYHFAPLKATRAGGH